MTDIPKIDHRFVWQMSDDWTDEEIAILKGALQDWHPVIVPPEIARVTFTPARIEPDIMDEP